MSVGEKVDDRDCMGRNVECGNLDLVLVTAGDINTAGVVGRLVRVSIGLERANIEWRCL